MSTTVVKQIIIGAIAFIVIGIAVGFGPQLLSGFEATRGDVESVTQTTANTPAASGSANRSAVTLARPLVAADVSYLTSVTSNITGQTLTFVAATITTTSVNVTGFDNTNLQTLTTIYEYGTGQYYTGLSTVLGVGPTIVLLGFIIMVGVSGFMGIRIAGKS